MLGNFSMYNNGPWGFNQGGFGMMDGFGVFMGAFFGLTMLLVVAWTLYWKFHALWYAAKHDHKWWFIALLVINSLGILEIAYLYYFSKNMDKPSGHDENKVPMVPPASQ